VLIVDRSAENREVLRTALQMRGADILEASQPELGLALAREHHPSVIVLDLEIEAGSAAAQAIDAESQAQQTPIVLLGSARRARQNFPAGQFVAKPYHYAPLIRKIEELLAQCQQPLTRSA